MNRRSYSSPSRAAQSRAFSGLVVPAATYRLELRWGIDTFTDGNDYFSITVLELPAL